MAPVTVARITARHKVRMSLAIRRGVPTLAGVPPLVLDLDDPAAADPDLTGAKAANLARARVAGFPIVPGVVVTTDAVDRGHTTPAVRAALEAAIDHTIGRLGDVDLVVRSSSTIEDIGTSSMAGRFTSVLGVRSEAGLHDAIDMVVRSADRVRDVDGERRPIAVLVQRQVEAAVGGVMFGIDPVTGDRHHMVIEAVAGGPDRLVGGTVAADHYTVTRRGRYVAVIRDGHAPPLTRDQRHVLARLARRAERTFGSPQDIEWLIDPSGRVWFLQSRPVTAAPPEVERRHRGVRLGPGPLAETFPDPLRPLEIDLWVEPLRTGLIRSLRTVGAVSARRLDQSPIVTVVGGRVAVDLDLIGDGRGGVRRRLNPGRMLRRLVAAWRVGRLRVALPALADAVTRTIDDDLAGIPHPRTLDIGDLTALLVAARVEMATAHTYEILAGMLLDRDADLDADGSPAVTAAGSALVALVDGRAAGWDDRTLVSRAPGVLALTVPRLGALPQLPAASSVAPPVDGGMSARESLRLRARWLQELTSRIVQEVGERLVTAGVLERFDHVAHLSLDELVDVARGGPPPADLGARSDVAPSPPLPLSFRLAADGWLHPDPSTQPFGRRPPGSGVPAGGGRAEGVVVHSAADAVESAGRGEPVVLVTEHLTPDLASVLGHIVGLVAESGSALSHLAILARESGVATVAALDGARRRLPVGSHVVVDGHTGEVLSLEVAR
jgi:pyruvate,water dikinase